MASFSIRRSKGMIMRRRKRQGREGRGGLRRTEKEEESVTLDTAILAQIRNGGKGRRNRTPGRPKGPRRTPRLGARKAPGGLEGARRHGPGARASRRQGARDAQGA